MIASKFIQLDDEHIEAIVHQATSQSFGGDIHDILRSYPLATLLKMADLAACYLEGEK